jgi:hypothetical protein
MWVTSGMSHCPGEGEKQRFVPIDLPTDVTSPWSLHKQLEGTG